MAHNCIEYVQKRIIGIGVIYILNENIEHTTHFALNSIPAFFPVHLWHSAGGVSAQLALLDNVSLGKESEASSIPHGWLLSHQLIKIKRGHHCLHGVASWIFETRAQGVVYWADWRDARGILSLRPFQKLIWYNIENQ